MDVSLSMRVSDVKPTRLAAAQEAAKLFLRDLPKNIEVGLVTFAESAQVVQAATLDRSSLVSAIDAFQMQYGTAIGDAIVVCLAELFPDQGVNLGDVTFDPRQKARGREGKDHGPPKQITPVAPGSYGSAAILLLSDGRRTTGVDTLEAAKMAADRGVRIHVVGLGTVDGPVGAGEGLAIYMQLDEPTLREVARMTGGEYHQCGHGGGVAKRLSRPRLTPKGRDSRDRDHGAAGDGWRSPGTGSSVPVGALVWAHYLTHARDQPSLDQAQEKRTSTKA
jgi:Ca-activated chloride channel family protein